jgi:hypothetical protein
MKPIEYSGGKVDKMAIIGSIITKPLDLNTEIGKITLPSVEYQVVEIVKSNDKTIYITNQWYKENRVPLIIIEDIVESVTLLP